MHVNSLPIFKLGFVFFLLFSCKSLLYILDTSLLSDICFAKMFSLSVGGHCTVLMMSFAAQFLILMKSVYLLFLLSLMSLVLHLGNHSLIQCHED